MKRGMRRNILTAMKRREIDILIGTQMITKGHDFENVTLVGILDADMSLNFPDFRAAERTFQLLTQMSGRSGRAALSGRVIVQTHSPEHYAVKASERHDFFGFFNEEIKQRKELGYPPFGRLAMIKLSSLKEGLVEGYANELADGLRLAAGHRSPATILGPTPAPISKVRNRYRWRILIKSGDMSGIRDALGGLAAHMGRAPRGIKVAVDVDPVNML
jgi:primosomal protein N' (replication factor Y)